MLVVRAVTCCHPHRTRAPTNSLLTHHTHSGLPSLSLWTYHQQGHDNSYKCITRHLHLVMHQAPDLFPETKNMGNKPTVRSYNLDQEPKSHTLDPPETNGPPPVHFFYGANNFAINGSTMIGLNQNFYSGRPGSRPHTQM